MITPETFLGGRVTQYCGDVREVLKQLPNESVHCVVTSPPYWGLRDYGTGQWVDGDPNCDHRVGGQVQDNKAPGAIMTGQRPGVDASRCKLCGATRVDQQIGIEANYADFVAEMVSVFREVKRVLRRDGTCWINLGDSYATAVNGRSAADTKATGNDDRTFRDKPFSTTGNGLKPKDICGIPWRVAFALQNDGWWLRQDIIWAKPNPMPESITDRCTKSHEYLFLLTKSERYWFDSDAIAEDAVGPPGGNTKPNKSFYHDSVKHRTKAGLAASQERARQNGGFESRNKRSVWFVATQPYPEAHFATFPTALIEPCILAGCPDGGMALDPFGGSGTTALVAVKNGRNAILVELNPEYAKMARRRIEGAFEMGKHEAIYRKAKELGGIDLGPLFTTGD